MGQTSHHFLYILLLEAKFRPHTYRKGENRGYSNHGDHSRVFLPQSIWLESESVLSQLCPILCDPGDCSLPAPILCDPGDCSLPAPRPWDFPGKNTEMGCHFLHEIFLTQGLNLGLPHCRQMLYHLSHQGRDVWLEVYQFIDIFKVPISSFIIFFC